MLYKTAISKLCNSFLFKSSATLIIDPKAEEMQEKLKEFGDILWEKRSRDGYTKYKALKKDDAEVDYSQAPPDNLFAG